MVSGCLRMSVALSAVFGVEVFTLLLHFSHCLYIPLVRCPPSLFPQTCLATSVSVSMARKESPCSPLPQEFLGNFQKLC